MVASQLALRETRSKVSSALQVVWVYTPNQHWLGIKINVIILAYNLVDPGLHQ